MAGLRLRAITGILSEGNLQAINQLLQVPGDDAVVPPVPPAQRPAF